MATGADPTTPAPDVRPSPGGPAPRPSLDPGTPIEVRNRFQGTWTRGFTVAGVTHGGQYTVRRTSDGSILAGTFGRDAIRRERRRRSGWWY
ncbi:MAG: hypothetical protein M0Z95_24015 [Actinomycetota bacterium]|nr:hypothetical protein [Actinomycetota bacterium]